MRGGKGNVVGVFVPNGQEKFHRFLAGVTEAEEARGMRVEFAIYGKVGHAMGLAQRARRAYVWGGFYPKARAVLDELDFMGVRKKFVELGWFPQTEFLYFDDEGTNGAASMMRDDFGWVTEVMAGRLEETRESYLKGRRWSPGGPVLVPLQLERDMQIRKWSPFRSMDEFIGHCRQKFSGRQVVFRKHPLDPNSYHGVAEPTDAPPLDEAILEAGLVYGINSTVLLEAALMGVEVEAIGTSFLNGRSGEARERLLAALVAKQVPIGETVLAPWDRPELGMQWEGMKWAG